MDPYIDPEALDRAHPLTSRKLDNLARADAAYKAREVHVRALPSKLTLQTTDACNLSCPHCQIPKFNKTRGMDARWLEPLAREVLPDLIELHPTNLGEPFSWPHFRRLCQLLHEHGVVLDLTTNGTQLDARRIEWIAPIARDVKISFDGATAATFERFRRGADFRRVCDNVKALTSRLQRVTTRRPVVALQMTLMRDNVDELVALIDLASRLGVTRVKAYHLFRPQPEVSNQSLMGEMQRYAEEILPAALQRGAERGIDLQLAEPPGGTVADLLPRTCFLPWHESWADVDGAVVVCHSHGGTVAGTLDDFHGAWNGEVYQAVRLGFARGCPEGACDGCGMNYAKQNEHDAVPYDPAGFTGDGPAGAVRWSGRMRQFELQGRRVWT
jgi:MoaA/NifB/PqqE/SkfB family radical SAM enzyme